MIQIIVILLVMACHAPARAATAELGPNIVRNSGFDNDVAAWERPGDITEVWKDMADVRNGVQSLRYSNTDPAVYKTVTQVVPAKVGDVLHFSVWVKGKDITSANPNQGAGIYMEGYDERGNWITGSYAHCFSGSFDWKQSGSIYRVPASVTRVIVGLYMRNNTIGTAWFDDVEVRAEHETRPAVQALLLYPNYRGLTLPSNTTAWQARVRLFPAAYKTTSISLQSTISDAKGRILRREPLVIPVSDEKQTVSIAAPRGLKAGEYTWKLEATDGAGALHNAEFAVHVVARMPKNYVDAEGFTIVNGKRFFPLGVYMHPAADSDMQRLAGAGFNTVLSYSYGVENDPEGYLARAHRHGLRVIFSIKDMYAGMPYAPKVEDLPALAAGYITRFRDKPALLSWYINDELEPDYLPKIQAMYDQLKKLDPEHLAFSLLIDPGVSDQYFSSTDAIGSDPYPVVGGGSHLRKTTTYTRLSAGSAGQSKSAWMVPQMFDYAVYGASNKPYQPSADEMRNQAYQAIINGAKGLIFYSYFDLWYAPGAPGVQDQATFDKRWPAVEQMSKEISALSPAILQGQEFPFVREGNSDVELKGIRYGNELLLLVANPFYSAATVTVKSPAGWKPLAAKQGGLEATEQGAGLQLSVPSIGSGVFRFTRK